MNKENCTKGAVQLVPHQDNPDVRCVETVDERRIAEVLPYDTVNGAEESDANAELIAEAFNVLHETGMTPAELRLAVKELQHAMADLVQQIEWDETSFLNEDAEEGEENALTHAKAALSKHQPVTP